MISDRAAVLPVLAVAIATAIACSNPASPESVRIDPIQIDTVTVLNLATAQVSARVRGVIGDGCSTLKSVTQARSGNAVTLTILRERPENAVCTQIALLYDETIPLEGSYPAGRYTLKVNSLEIAFETN